MTRLKMYLAILASPDKALIEEYLYAAFGERNVFLIDSKNLELFFQDVLQKIFPNLHLQI